MSSLRGRLVIVPGRRSAQRGPGQVVFAPERSDTAPGGGFEFGNPVPVLHLRGPRPLLNPRVQT